MVSGGREFVHPWSDVLPNFREPPKAAWTKLSPWILWHIVPNNWRWPLLLGAIAAISAYAALGGSWL